MPSFRTIMPPVESEVKISHQDQTLCIGSCFAEHIGGRLRRLKFPSRVNPFGIVYNPVSVAKTLERLLSEEPFGEDDIFEHLGLWHSFAHHGHYSHPDRETALTNINTSFTEARDFLKKTNRLIVTLGTANVFVRKKTGEIVANCHKVPGSEFDRHRLDVEEVQNALVAIFEKLKKNFPSLEIIATVSPVRHLRDGLVENQRSKATLLLGLETVTQQLSFVRYFPSFEIVLDDLRDYRFYDPDMAHPDKVAVDYVWEYFENAFFSASTTALCRRIEKVITAGGHRPFHVQSVQHQRFVKKQLKDIDAMEASCPSLDFSSERAHFSSQIS